MWSNFWNGLGDIFSSIWTIMPTVGNLPNLFAIIIISILFIYWTIKLVAFKKNGES
jgi:hypothetical protein